MRKYLCSLLILTLVISMLAGCGSKDNDKKTETANETTNEQVNQTDKKTETDTGSEESVDKKVTLRIVAPSADENPPMQEWWLWKDYEKKNNIHIEWEEIPGTALEEKRNLMLNSKDLPDAFWKAGFNVGEISRYGQQGLFINLDDHMDKLPNLTALMEKIPSIKAVLTMPDGHIYSFPYIMEDTLMTSLRYYINNDWLNNLELKKPVTIEEYEDVLKAFKEKDANGNGDPNDEHPIYLSSGTIGWTFERQMLGSYGIGNHGGKAGDMMIYDENDGKIRFTHTSEHLKELWQLYKKWWDQGYFHPETFSNFEYEKWVSDGTTKDIVGTFCWCGPDYLYSDAGDHYAGINVLEGPYSKDLTWVDPPARSYNAFMITKGCKHLDEAMEWVDFWYSEEGSEYGFIGNEGETYEIKDGKKTYVDDILNYKGGSQLGAFQYGLLTYGGYYPYIEPATELIEEVRGYSMEDNWATSRDDVNKYLPEEIWPSFTPTQEEQDVLDTIWNDIATYVGEARAKFVTGEWNFDKDWDQYVEQLEKMGLNDYVKVRQSQYDRYNESMK